MRNAPRHSTRTIWLPINRIVVMLFCLLISLFGQAQQPAYSLFGEDQFRGIQIYDIIQDKDQNYWIATNDGLYFYNYVDFEKIECNGAKSVSFFNFVINANGVIFCHNINQQVFRIQNKTCEVIYELKKDEVGSDVSLAIGDRDELLVSSHKFIVLNQQGKVLKRFQLTKKYIAPAFTLPDKKLIYHLGFSDTLITYIQGDFRVQRLNKKAEVLKFIQLEKAQYAVDLNTKLLYPFDPRTRKLGTPIVNPMFSRSQSLRIYQTNKEVWLAGTLPGAYCLRQFPGVIESDLFYNNFFISDVFQDAEGNLLLSTFEKGIIVIPSLDVPDVLQTFQDDPINSLFSCQTGELILGTSKGKLLAFHGTFRALSETGNRPVEVVSCNKNLVVYDDGMIRVLNKKTGKNTPIIQASLKAALSVDENSFYLGTNRGVYRLRFKKNGTPELIPIPGLSMRVHLMTYDPIRRELYVSTTDGLFILKASGKLIPIKYKGKNIYPNDMHGANGSVYVLTRKSGILVYEQGTFKRTILPKIEWKVFPMSKLRVFNNKFIASSTFGLYEFNMKGKHVRAIQINSGFSTKRVIDFAIHNKILWVSHSGGFQHVDLNLAKRRPAHLPIRFDKILVGSDQDYTSRSENLERGQNRIKFVFSSPTLRNRELIRFFYRLRGSDDNWSILKKGQNEVTFNALSPGTYVFEVKAGADGVYSKIIAYRFTVPVPIYLTWWFLTISGLLFLGIVYVIYKRQLAIQQRKAAQINELHASKLTAIQSQMNPHFIFNSLNSIQDLILKGDVEHSYSYITTFSDLVRRTLNYSQKDFIDFEQEVKLLNLYLSLEKLRFKKDFEYELITDDVADILLPPLLVQPFIENALVHGLLHKEGLKRLKVSFTFEESLICIIEDNGVGREQARTIRQRQRGDHESFSSEAIRKRFEILSRVFDGEFGFEIVDLNDAESNCGTRVILRIPFRPKF